MLDIKKEINKLAEKYSKPFYVRADEPDLTLWGLRVGKAHSTIALYKKQNKLLVNINNYKTWFTTDVYKNYRSVFEEVIVHYERLTKYAPQNKNNS